MLPRQSAALTLTVVALVAEVLLGFLTFTGSLMATGKLQGISWIPQRPVTYPYRCSNIGLLLLAVLLGLFVVLHPHGFVGGLAFHLIVLMALAFGVLLIIPIGGADIDGDFDSEFLCRTFGCGDGVCVGKQFAHHGRGAGWLERFDSVDHHVPGDEPFVHEVLRADG